MYGQGKLWRIISCSMLLMLKFDICCMIIINKLTFNNLKYWFNDNLLLKTIIKTNFLAKASIKKTTNSKLQFLFKLFAGNYFYIFSK